MAIWNAIPHGPKLKTVILKCAEGYSIVCLSWDAKNLIEEVKKMRDEELGTKIPTPDNAEVRRSPPGTHLAWTEPNDLKIAQLNQENAKLKAKILRLEKVIDKMTELRELERRLP